MTFQASVLIAEDPHEQRCLEIGKFSARSVTVYIQKWVISAIQSHGVTVYSMAAYLKQ